MASMLKKCRHQRGEWDSCGCSWYIRERSGGRDLYTPAGSDREAAEAALARHKRGGEETVSAALDAWLAAKKRDPNARPNSIASYSARVEHVRRGLGPNTVRSLRDDTITRFVEALLAEEYAPATVQGIYACLTSTLRHAQRRGVIKALPLPVDGPGIPEVTPRVHAITLARLDGVLSEMPGKWGVVAEIILLTGLRWGEVVALERGDIEGHFLHVRRTRNRTGGVNPPKTKKGQRVIPLSPKALQLLEGLDLPATGSYREARKALVAAFGVHHQAGMGWHTIRNAHATLLEAAGVALRDQAARMGHGTNYAQTLSYGISQAGSAENLDAVRRHASSPSSASPGRDELADRRGRRKTQGA